MLARITLIQNNIEWLRGPLKLNRDDWFTVTMAKGEVPSKLLNRWQMETLFVMTNRKQVDQSGSKAGQIIWQNRWNSPGETWAIIRGFGVICVEAEHLFFNDTNWSTMASLHFFKLSLFLSPILSEFPKKCHFLLFEINKWSWILNLLNSTARTFWIRGSIIGRIITY